MNELISIVLKTEQTFNQSRNRWKILLFFKLSKLAVLSNQFTESQNIHEPLRGLKHFYFPRNFFSALHKSPKIHRFNVVH